MRPRYIALIIVILLAIAPHAITAALNTIAAPHMEPRHAAQSVPEDVVTAYMKSDAYLINKAEKLHDHLDLPSWTKTYYAAQLLVLSKQAACFQEYDYHLKQRLVTCVKNGEISHPYASKTLAKIAAALSDAAPLIWAIGAVLFVYCCFSQRFFQWFLIASIPIWIPAMLMAFLPSRTEMVQDLSGEQIEAYRKAHVAATALRTYGDIGYEYSRTRHVLAVAGASGCYYDNSIYHRDVAVWCVSKGRWASLTPKPISALLTLMELYSFLFFLLLAPVSIGLGLVWAIIGRVRRKNPSNS
jgi:hypothetical protein